MSTLEIDRTRNLSPIATHRLLYGAKEFPNELLDLDEARERVGQFVDAGFVAIGGVLVIQEMGTIEAIGLHEKGHKLIESGCLLGPYIIGDEVMRGVQFFQPNV